jgi:hypothetical protein
MGKHQIKKRSQKSCSRKVDFPCKYIKKGSL